MFWCIVDRFYVRQKGDIHRLLRRSSAIIVETEREQLDEEKKAEKDMMLREQRSNF